MLFSYFVRRENRDEWGGRGGLLYVGTAVRFLTFYQAHCAYNLESEVAGGFDGLHGGGAGGANVVDDDDGSTFFAEAFDALARAVLLLGFADEESVYFATGDSDGDNDGVGTHGEASDGFGFPSEVPDFFEENFAGELRAAGIERGGAAIDVVVAGSARGQLEFPEAE
jgi:hypothetical protein